MGRRLASLRALHGLSQEAAAERAGFKQSYLSLLENDKATAPPIQTIAALAAIYESSIDYIVNGSEAA
jgi:transcriptional regulator with XRE-family HTH domain